MKRMEYVKECGQLVTVTSDEVSILVNCLLDLDYSTVCGGDI